MARGEPLREGDVHPLWTMQEASDKGRRLTTSSPFHFDCRALRGACGKPWVVSYNRQPGPAIHENRLGNMPACAPPDFAGLLARDGLPQIAGGMSLSLTPTRSAMLAGGWR